MLKTLASYQDVVTGLVAEHQGRIGVNLGDVMARETTSMATTSTRTARPISG